jgi:SAM-dependent methyltransferase
MSDDKISSNPAIDAAMRLDGDPQNLRDYYDDWARNYNLDITSAEYSGPAISARLLRQYLDDSDASLLDAGCGTGLVGIELQALGYRRIDGFDLSESMIEQAGASGVYRKLGRQLRRGVVGGRVYPRPRAARGDGGFVAVDPPGRIAADIDAHALLPADRFPAAGG